MSETLYEDWDGITFEAWRDYDGNALVRVSAGGDFDPYDYLSADDARRAAIEWPAILNRLADEAEKLPIPKRGPAMKPPGAEALYAREINRSALARMAFGSDVA